MEERRNFELFIDRGFGEKKIIIAEQPIDLNPSTENTLYKVYKPEVVVFGCNGTAPPFEKGTAVLRDIRKATGLPIHGWKQILEISDDPDKIFSILELESNDSEQKTNHQGVWLHKSTDHTIYPDLIVLNYQTQLIRYKLKKSNLSEDDINDKLPEILSKLYRSLLAAIDAYQMFYLGKVTIKRILMSDIGSKMLSDAGKTNNQAIRITIFSQVIGSWLGIHPEMDSIIIAYAEGHTSGNLQKQINLWAEQEKASLGEEADLSNAVDLRNENHRLCLQLSARLSKRNDYNALVACLKTTAEIYSSGNAIYATDALQARKLTEALTLELTGKYETKSDTATLDAYIKRLEATKRISPWMTSYMHLVRVLGNEAAHYNKEEQKRPERPAGKDLTVIHAALGRILSFCLNEFSANE